MMNNKKSILMLIILTAEFLPSYRCHGEEYESVRTIYTKLSVLGDRLDGNGFSEPLRDAFGHAVQTQGTPGPFPIISLQIVKPSAVLGRKKILILGTQHAREKISYRCVLDLATFVVDQVDNTTWPGQDSRFDYFRKFKEMNIKKLTENARIIFIPVLNPAGYSFALLDTPGDAKFWRKNRRDTPNDPPGNGPSVPPPSTENNIVVERGVDLNRNWPSSDWGHVGLRQFPPGAIALGLIRTSRYKIEESYCGHPIPPNWPAEEKPAGLMPLLERETDGIIELSNSLRFDLMIDVHSYGRIVGWNENADLAQANLRPDQEWTNDNDLLRALAQRTAERIGGYGVSTGPYPVSGESLFYNYEKTGKRALTFLVEVGTDFFPVNPTPEVQKVIAGELFLMFAAVDQSFASKPKAKFRKP